MEHDEARRQAVRVLAQLQNHHLEDREGVLSECHAQRLRLGRLAALWHDECHPLRCGQAELLVQGRDCEHSGLDRCRMRLVAQLLDDPRELRIQAQHPPLVRA